MSAELFYLGLLDIGVHFHSGWMQASPTVRPQDRTRLATTTPASPRTDITAFTKAVHDAANQLPPMQARALWLVDVCGASYAQGAAETRTTPEGFARLVHTARDSIRKAVS